MTSEAVSRREHYRLDAAASTFTVQAFAEGLFSAFGHDPVIGVRRFEGEVALVPVTFDNVSLKLRIDASSLAVANDLKEKDRREIEHTMRQEVLEIHKYPEIVFQSNNISLARLGEGRYRARVIGALTLRGVTQNNVWISGEVTVRPDGLRAKGEFALKQTDYKIKPVSVAGGTLKIKNEVKGRFDVLARPDG
jgi:polyisoprenoid-binding protein YceI